MTKHVIHKDETRENPLVWDLRINRNGLPDLGLINPDGVFCSCLIIDDRGVGRNCDASEMLRKAGIKMAGSFISTRCGCS